MSPALRSVSRDLETDGGRPRAEGAAERRQANPRAVWTAAEENGYASGTRGIYRQTAPLIRNKPSPRDSYRLPLLSSSRGSAAAKIAAVASTISTPTESGKNGAKTSSSEVQKASVFVPRTAGEVVDRVNARSTNVAGETLWRQLTLIPPIFVNRLPSNQC